MHEPESPTPFCLHLKVLGPTAAWYSFGNLLKLCLSLQYPGWWSDDWKKILTLGIYESAAEGSF